MVKSNLGPFFVWLGYKIDTWDVELFGELEEDEVGSC